MKFVFCEGKDDLSVIKAVAFSINIIELQIEPFDGTGNLSNFLKSAKTRPEFTRNEVKSIGIIRDADDNSSSAFLSVKTSLENNGFTAPAQNGGFSAGEPRTGILIIGKPDGTGMIEDLCLSSVSDRPEFPCVDEYFRCVTEKSGRKDFSPKAKVRAWMASHRDYAVPFGKAAEKGHWPWQHPAFDPLKEFLKRL